MSATPEAKAEVRSILAVDLGGTSLRAALVDGQGRIGRQGTVGVSRGVKGPAGEVDPEAWWTALARAVEELTGESAAALADVEAVAIAGITRTQVFLGSDGQVLRPALTWSDTRAGEIAAEVSAALPPGHPEAGALNAFHPVARLLWMRRHEPEVFRALATVLEPKDYLNFRLTGVRATDPISSARLLAAAARDAGGASLLESLDLPGRLVPAPVEPTAIVGRVAAGLPGLLGALANRPVVAMANDTWTSVVGLGALRAGRAYNLSGTTEVFGVLSRKKAFAEGLLTLGWGEGLHHLGGPSQNGADTLVWALSLLSRFEGDPLAIGPELETLLAGPRDPQPMIFLPHLQGERTPYWDPKLRGALIGLNRRHRAVDFLFAVLEGIAFLNRVVLARAERVLGEVGEIRFGGGGAASTEWCRIKADICERPLVVTEAAEPGLLGAAITAWTALGRFASLEAGQEALVRAARRFEPDHAKREHYRHLFGLFQAAEHALRPISVALADDPGPRGRRAG